MAIVLSNSGRSIIANRLKGSGTEPKYVACGTGAGTALVTDTTLFSEVSEQRASGTSSRVTVTLTDDTYQVIGTIFFEAAKTITNAGLFDALSGGNLFLKSDSSTWTPSGSIAVETDDSISFTFKLTF